jgi:hypothetical protein
MISARSASLRTVRLVCSQAPSESSVLGERSGRIPSVNSPSLHLHWKTFRLRDHCCEIPFPLTSPSFQMSRPLRHPELMSMWLPIWPVKKTRDERSSIGQPGGRLAQAEGARAGQRLLPDYKKGCTTSAWMSLSNGTARSHGRTSLRPPRKPGAGLWRPAARLGFD